MKINNCTDCKHHNIYPDPDPGDCICDDDVKVVCALTDKKITYACRPYNVKKESKIPNFCPLIKNKDGEV